MTDGITSKRSTLKAANRILDFLQKLIVVLGVPLALYKYIDEKGKERGDREILINQTLDDKYWAYEQLCLAYPQLDVSEVTEDDPALDQLVKHSHLTPTERIREREILYLAISLDERAFLRYKDQDTDFKREQYESWVQSMKNSFKKKNFQDAWNAGRGGFDAKFQAFMDDLMRDTAAKARGK